MAGRPPGALRAVAVRADPGWHEAIRDGRFDFFTKLGARLAQAGIPMRLVPPGSHADGDELEIVVGERPSYGPRVLHAMPSYVWGFWYLDETGVHWNSSLRLAGFRPEAVEAGAAAYFFNGVAGHMLRENVSKFPQPARSGLQPAAAAVFCQEIEGYRHRCHYLTTEEMIRTAAEAAGGARVYVKPHPNQSPPMRQAIRAICAEYPHVRLSRASVHDLSGAARVVVTQNSAAGFEALMQRRPVVTCAKSDYHHATLVARTEEELRAALHDGPRRMEGFPFEKYLYWFLGLNCLEPAQADFADRAFARIREKCLF